jgi:hypothetical protein
MITVIAPHARPEFSANLLANFQRQQGVDAQLVVVQNGAASKVSWPAGVTVLASVAHQSDAMNAGLTWLRTHGNGRWARFDDDDYYGPSYLADTERALNAHEVVGKTWGFVLFDEGLYRFDGVENGSSDKLTGGTLAARTADVLLFRRQIGEDLQWCRDLRARGVDVWAGSHRGYCYDRRSARNGAPRIITSGPVVTRWGFGGTAEYHGAVLPTYVDSPGEPRRIVGKPTDEELVEEMSR